MKAREPLMLWMLGPATRLTAIAVALGIVAGAAIVLIAPPGPTPPTCSDRHLGSGFALSPAKERTIGIDHWYNFTVQSSGGGTLHRDFNFSVEDHYDSVIPPGSSWTFTALNNSGKTIGTYSMYGPGAGTWTTGGDLLVSNQETWSLLATPTNLSGGYLVAFEAALSSDPCAGFGGATTAAIP
jgi:hypothetical protein